MASSILVRVTIHPKLTGQKCGTENPEELVRVQQDGLMKHRTYKPNAAVNQSVICSTNLGVSQLVDILIWSQRVASSSPAT
jgi:hypothetical protein